LVTKGDLLISWSASLGIYEWGESDAWLNQHIFKVEFNKLKWDKNFFKHLISSKLDEMIGQVHGATMKHITKGKFDNIDVPYPPLATQQKIAAILDEADALRRKDKALLAKYDELLQAVFYDMFGDPVKNEKGWESGTIRDVVTEVKYGTSKPAEDSGQYPYLRMNNITYTGDWDFSSMKYINLTEGERDKYLIRKGDLVFNRTNSKELVGKTAVYELDEEMAIAGYLIRVRTNERADANYLSAYLNSKHGKKTLTGMCKSIIGMANINAQELQDIKILIPPVELQNRFAEICSNIQHQKSQIIQQQTHSEQLFQSLMQRAFAGRLVG
jgi:type I restriction enzyme S subunit